MTEYAFEGVTRSSPTVTWSFETQTYAADASFAFSSPITAQYQSIIQAAFARWAGVAGLNFVQVPDSPNAAIRIGFGIFNASNVIGQTIIRSTNKILNADTVVRLLDPAYSNFVPDIRGGYDYGAYGITLFQVATHEIGHALGLDHTTDPLTLMYPIGSSLNQDLALGDIQGINALYPLYSVTAVNPIQIEGNGGSIAYRFDVTRYSDPAGALTVNYGVAGAAYPGLAGTTAATASEFGGALPTGQITFAAGSTKATLTIAVAGNTVASPDQGFTVAFSSTNPAITATTRGAVNAVILDDDGYATLSNGSLGIYRFFDNLNGTHFFTANEAERNALITTRADMTYEGVDLAAVAAPATDPAATAIYRFFDTSFGTHFYTADTAERDGVLASRPDLTFEGTAFYEDRASQAGDVPVYRFFDTRNGTHFYTADTAERATILATRPDLANEGVAFYAPATA